MENNNIPPQPVVPGEPVTPGDSKNLIVWFVIGLIGVILIVGGIYVFLSKGQPAAKPQTTASKVPSPAPEANLENDLNSINVKSGIDSDFTSVDQDLKSL